MKILGLCLLLVSVLVVSAPAQGKPSLSAADKAVIQEWLVHAESDAPAIQGDHFVITIDNSDTYCAFMRTYRMKREAEGSDVTRPSGYTTCVPVQRFGVKRAAPPSDKMLPSK